ncbi:MAG TPA: MFS transporter [Vicinamibacteria bacterium]|nr:MFS transporter [Vicinamibacteria bacterium]
MNKRTAAVALMAVFTVAVCFIVLGSVSSDIMRALNLDAAQFGSLVMALFLTCCIVQLFVGPAVDRFGYKPLAVLGFVVTSASIFMLAFASSFATAFAACVLLGVGAMALNTVGNTLIPVVLFEGQDPARASNFGNAFFGLGYVSVPFLFTLFLQKLGMSYGVSLSVFGALTLLFLVFSLTASYPNVPIGFSFGKAAALLSQPAVLVAALALFCYISLEISMGSWIRRVMEEILGRSQAPADASFWAGMVLSLFGLSMAAGRFLSSAVKNLTAIGVRVVAGAAVVSLVAILIMMWTDSAALAILAIVLTGLAFAPIFPTVVGVTFAKFDSSQYGSIFGIIFAIGLLGGTFVPKWIGNLSVAGTVQGSLKVAALMAALLIVVAPVLGVVGRKALDGKKAT